MEQVKMPIKTEEERAATFVVHTDSEINVKFFKQDQGLIQSVKNEPSFANDAVVKEEILEDSTQDEREHQCVHDASTPAATGGVNETCSTSLGDLLNVKYESTEMEIGPTLLQDMDTINKNTSAAPEENAILDDYNEATPGGRVKKERGEGMWRDDSEKHCLSTAAGAGSLYEANDLSHGDCLSVKQELEDIDIGPTVLQHMDIHYALNKKPVDDFNKAMRCSGVNQSVEDKLRDTKIKCDSCGQTTTDYDEAHLKSCLGQQKDLQQHLLRQQLTTTSNCCRCDACGKTFHKPHLLSAHRKPQERNSATSGATSSSVAGPSNVRRSEATKAEPKPFKCEICDKGYSSVANLSTHKRFHSGVGLYVCRICSTKFNSKSHLTIHLRTHTGEKPYQCDTCNARFSTNGTLTKHKRVHTGEKPYQCDTCNARFSTNSALIIHNRVPRALSPTDATLVIPDLVLIVL